MSTKRALMLGAGGMAGAWIRHMLPHFKDRLTVTGLVDINPQALQDSGDFLGLPENRRFTDMKTAFEQVEADLCIIVVPPAFHKEAVLYATERRMDILSEKPIADTWEACCDIYRAVKQSGVKMTVVQNYRFSPWILALKEVLQTGELGRVNYAIARFADDYRIRNAWGKFRHEIPHSLLIEGSVHHFDQLRNLVGSDCTRIAGFDWNPVWSSFDGECCGLYVMEFANGAHATYEGHCLAAGTLNGWHGEMYRIECERGAVSIGQDRVVRVVRRIDRGRNETIEIARHGDVLDGHRAIIKHCLDWLDGGPEPATRLDDNIKSVAMVFAAIIASETRSMVDITAMLEPLGVAVDHPGSSIGA